MFCKLEPAGCESCALQLLCLQALYVRVVRKEGPQLSLIDLPGVTHNADQMQNIHEAGRKMISKDGDSRKQLYNYVRSPEDC